MASLIAGCKENRQAQLEGTWNIDSVYTYYNGFGNMETNIIDLERYEYQPGGKVDVTWNESTRSMTYQVRNQDSLIYYENDAEVSRYLIMTLKKNQMVLRKDKQPIFKGKGQERYEIRFFSRSDSAK